MQLEISREALLRPSATGVRCPGGRPTPPILGNVPLDVSNGFAVADRQIPRWEMIGQVISTATARMGRTTVPARKLLDICRGLPEGRISVSTPKARG